MFAAEWQMFNVGGSGNGAGEGGAAYISIYVYKLANDVNAH